MKTFYVLLDGVKYLSFNPKTSLAIVVLPDGTNSWLWSVNLGEAKRFESLCQALEFNESSGLKLEVLRVDITSAWTPDLFTENLPE